MSQDGGRDDAELDAFLGRSSDLQRRWRAASQEEPPAALDDKVRAAARRATGAGPRALHTPFSTRWRVPLSIAAVVVVSATVTLMVADRSEHLPGTQSEDLRTTAPAAQPPAPPAEDESSAAADSQAAPSSADAPLAAPVVPARVAPERRRLEDAVRKQEEVRQYAPDPPREADSAAAPAPVPPPVATGTDAARDREAAPAARMQENGAMERQAAPSRGDTAFDASKPAPSRAAGGVRAMPQAPAAATRGAAEEPAPAPAPAEAKRESSERIEQYSTPASAVQESAADASREEPLRWIERIRALRRAGKSAEAEESLREFRRQYPAYPLPEDLQPPR